MRLAAPGDGAAISAIYAPIVEGTAISFETSPPTAAAMAERIRATVARLPWLVCEVGDDVVGYAYASPHHDRPAYRWSVNVSVYVDAGRRRRGVATGLYRSLFAVLDELGLRTAFAGITLPNAASVAFHEAFGFEPVGVFRDAGYKLGSWHDVGWWGRPVGDRADPPAAPIPLSDRRGTDRLAAAVAAGEPSVTA